MIISNDQYGRTIISAEGTSRRGIISRNGDRWHFVPAVNNGETVVRGGRTFATLNGALRAADKFVAGTVTR